MYLYQLHFKFSEISVSRFPWVLIVKFAILHTHLEKGSWRGFFKRHNVFQYFCFSCYEWFGSLEILVALSHLHVISCGKLKKKRETPEILMILTNQTKNLVRNCDFPKTYVFKVSILTYLHVMPKTKQNTSIKSFI